MHSKRLQLSNVSEKLKLDITLRRPNTMYKYFVFKTTRAKNGKLCHELVLATNTASQADKVHRQLKMANVPFETLSSKLPISI